MSVVQLHMDKKERKESVGSMLYLKALEDKRAKEIAKDLTKGYMKMLSNFN